MTKSWWRTARVSSLAEAQLSLDRWSVEVADLRRRPGGTAGSVGAAEPLAALTTLAYPALITVQRKASRSALVAFEANHYSVPPAFAGRSVTVQTRLGESRLSVISASGETVATHRRAATGAGQTVRTSEHAQALERAVLAAFTTDHACRRKENRPPGDAALAQLAALGGLEPELGEVISLAAYQEFAEASTAVSR